MLYATLIKAAKELDAGTGDSEYLRGIVELISSVTGPINADEFSDFENVKDRVYRDVVGVSE